MAETTLRAVTGTRGHTAAIKDGSIRPGRYELSFEEYPVLPQAFRKMVRGTEFDVTEMAFTTYLCARAHGKPFTALPVFLVRGFHHGAVTRSRAAGPIEPRDLAGRRAGVNRGYTVTTGVWARGILADWYGVDLDRVTWVLSGDEHVTEWQPPANVVPAGPGQDVPEMVASGELDAGIGLPARPDVGPLLPDPERAGYEALRWHGLYPINHLLVVKDELLAADPDLAPALFAAYARAKNEYTERLRAKAIAGPGPEDRMYERVMEITGADPLPYGIAPNRGMIEKLIGYAVSQHILDKPVTPDEIFAAGTHDLTA